MIRRSCILILLLSVVLLLMCVPVAQAASWTVMETPTQAHSVAFADSQTGWVGGKGIVWRTVNGGQDWKALPAGPHNARSHSPSTAFHGAVISIGALDRSHAIAIDSSGMVCATSNGGTSWTKVAIKGAKAVSYADSTHAYVIAGAGVFTSHDGGMTWSATPVTGPSPWASISVWAPGSGFAVGGAIASTTNGFAGFATSPVPGGDTDKALTVRTVGPAAAYLLAVDTVSYYTCSLQMHVLFTGDGGATWVSKLDLNHVPSDGSRAMAFESATSGWVVTPEMSRHRGARSTGLVRHTTNGGAKWVTEQVPGNGHLVDMSAPGKGLVWAVTDNGRLLYREP